MPTPEEIEKKTSRLPVIPIDKVTPGFTVKDREIWVKWERGVRLRVTRHFAPSLSEEIFFVSVYGNIRSRNRVAMEFKEVWGEPMASEDIDETFFALWPANGRGAT